MDCYRNIWEGRRGPITVCLTIASSSTMVTLNVLQGTGIVNLEIFSIGTIYTSQGLLQEVMSEPLSGLD